MGREDHITVVRPGAADPALSVLMPLFRCEAHVAEATASVLSQRGVTVEIIISDDGSDDGTLDRALKVVEAYAGPHRVVVRRGVRRLWRDHLAVLVDLASCDIVMQAHQDDISHPDRARIVLDVMDQTGAVLVGSEAAIIDWAGTIIEEPSAALGGHRLASIDEVLRYPATLIGARLAWRRSALAPFGRLDTAAAAIPHDRVLALRGALAGPIAVAEGPLLGYRYHSDNSSWALADRRSPSALSFGAAVNRLSLMRVLDRDLDRAHQQGLISETDENAVRSLVVAQRAALLEQALDAHNELLAAGRLPMWLDADEVALANRGLLRYQLQAQAVRTTAMVGPLRLALRMARAGRRRFPGAGRGQAGRGQDRRRSRHAIPR